MNINGKQVSKGLTIFISLLNIHWIDPTSVRKETFAVQRHDGNE